MKKYVLILFLFATAIFAQPSWTNFDAWKLTGTVLSPSTASWTLSLPTTTFTGTATIPTPFTLGAVSVTTTGTQLNYLNGATGTTGTTTSNIVFSAAPTFTGNTTFDTNTLFVDAVNHRVGIGTTGPSSTLQVGTGATSALGSFNGIAALHATSSYITVKSGTNPEVYMGSDPASYGIIGTLSNHALGFRTNNTLKMSLSAAGGLSLGSYVGTDAGVGNMIISGNVGIGYTSDPTSGNKLFVNGNGYFNGTLTATSSITSTQFRLSALNTAPATATDTGTLGEIRIVNGFIFVCVAANTWQRVAIATW